MEQNPPADVDPQDQGPAQQEQGPDPPQNQALAPPQQQGPAPQNQGPRMLMVQVPGGFVAGPAHLMGPAAQLRAPAQAHVGPLLRLRGPAPRGALPPGGVPQLRGLAMAAPMQGPHAHFAPPPNGFGPPPDAVGGDADATAEDNPFLPDPDAADDDADADVSCCCTCEDITDCVLDNLDGCRDICNSRYRFMMCLGLCLGVALVCGLTTVVTPLAVIKNLGIRSENPADLDVRAPHGVCPPTLLPCVCPCSLRSAHWTALPSGSWCLETLSVLLGGTIASLKWDTKVKFQVRFPSKETALTPSGVLAVSPGLFPQYTGKICGLRIRFTGI